MLHLTFFSACTGVHVCILVCLSALAQVFTCGGQTEVSVGRSFIVPQPIFERVSVTGPGAHCLG